MSMFTAPKSDAKPACERCKKADFVVLVSRGEEYNTWKCRRCAIPTKVPKT